MNAATSKQTFDPNDEVKWRRERRWQRWAKRRRIAAGESTRKQKKLRPIGERRPFGWPAARRRAMARATGIANKQNSMAVRGRRHGDEQMATAASVQTQRPRARPTFAAAVATNRRGRGHCDGGGDDDDHAARSRTSSSPSLRLSACSADKRARARARSTFLLVVVQREFRSSSK